MNHFFRPQSPFGCSSFADLLTGTYSDTGDTGSLPEELDPFPEIQLGNPHPEEPSHNHPQAASLTDEVQPDSLR